MLSVVDNPSVNSSYLSFKPDDYFVYPLAAIAGILALIHFAGCYREFQERKGQEKALVRDKSITYKIEERKAKARASQLGAEAGELSRKIHKEVKIKADIDKVRLELLKRNGSIHPLNQVELNFYEAMAYDQISSLNEEHQRILQQQRNAIESAEDSAHLADFFAHE